MTSKSPEPLVYENPEISHDPNIPGTLVTLPLGVGPLPRSHSRRIFYFDIDNCLYMRSTRIHDMMQVKIHQYFCHTLGLDDKTAHELHLSYYKTYGLALEGLVRNHTVDALEYNSAVDDALDLKAVLSYNQQLRNMLIRIRKNGNYDCLWLMTNAYKNHALRVISFLGVGDLFDGLTYCRYDQSPILCKPMPRYFLNCLQVTGIDHTDPKEMKLQSFVDDSEINVKAAHRLGFGLVYHYVELANELETLYNTLDFEEYYGDGKNTDRSKIMIIRDILDLEKLVL